MREILFKGKRIDNGEWVEGQPVEITFGKWIIRKFATSFAVDPTTICEYTGLTDKNGTKIFEGDIIRLETGDGKIHKADVKWDKEIARFEMDKRTGFYSVYEDSICGFNAGIFNLSVCGKCEVIGSIHDATPDHEGGANE